MCLLFSELFKPYKRQTQKIARLETTRLSVRGLVQLLRNIYIACISKSALIVYEAEFPYTRLEDIAIEELTYPRDMAACCVCKCIYVSDKIARRVWRVRQNDRKVEIFINNLKGGASLSMMSNGNLLVLDKSDLCIYASDGKHLQTMKLPDELVEPHIAIATGHDTFLISHGESCGLHRICEITPKGDILRTYGHLNGPGIGQLDWPVHMTLDNEGRIIVLDAINVRFLLLDSKLRLLRVLISRQDGVAPTLRMCYVKDTGNLLVGTIMTIENGGVDIFRIRDVEKLL